jgi:ornithine cyclodeaminase/alanine dehydrogenase-like protein (mu-crystallin family)
MRLRLLSESHIRSIAPTVAEIVALVEAAYRLDAEGKVAVPTKIGVHPDRARSFLHAMPAWVGGPQALGMKWVSYYPGNPARGLPTSAAIIILNDPEHGLPCCIMEGMYVTFLRTAACAAVAAKYLAPRAPQTLGLVGCGDLGRWSLRVMSAAFPSIEQVFVSSRRSRSREAFCAEMAGEVGWTLTPVDDPAAAVRGLDVVITSIPPVERRPVSGDALTPGTLLIPLDVVNSWDDNVLRCVDRIAADDPAHFAARITARGATNVPAVDAITRTQDLVIGKSPRASSADRSLVGVCGIASTDVVVGWEIHRRASAADVGVEFDLQDG